MVFQLLLSEEDVKVLGELLEKTIESNLIVLQYYVKQYPEGDSKGSFGHFVKNKLMLETNQLTALQDRLLEAKSTQPTESRVTT